MSDTQNVKDLPEWAQTMISDLRNEAAAARVSKREAVESAVAAERDKLTRENEAVVKELNEKVTSLSDDNGKLANRIDRYEATFAAGVATEHISDFASRLVGNTAEELKADAEKAKSLYNPAGKGKGQPAIDLSAGLGNAGDATPTHADAFADFINRSLNRS